MFTDYYELLQISPTAETDIVSAAYKRLAVKYHPDSGGDTKSEEKMKLLNEARAVLTDPTQRTAYDLLWQQENAKKQRIEAAKFLLDQKKYSEAKAILIGIVHPTADKWLALIDSILAQQAAVDQSPRDAAAANDQWQTPSSQPAPEAGSVLKPNALDLEELAELWRLQTKQRNAARKYAQVHNDLAAAQELQHFEEYRQNLIQTYETVGYQAFQWEESVAARYHSAASRKMKAWNAILARRFEEARTYIIATSRDIDQNMRDWLIIIDYILSQETVIEKFGRLGIVGLFSYRIDIGGCRTTFIAWNVCIAIGLLAFGAMGLGASSTCISIMLMAFLGFTFLKSCYRSLKGISNAKHTSTTAHD